MYDVKVLNKNDRYYPKLLKEIADPPETLFCQGNIRLLENDNLVSIVGTRMATMYGINETKRIVQICKSQSVNTVSGFAMGIDEAVHNYSIENNVPTIAVLPSSLADIYPKENFSLAQKILANKGLLVTEIKKSNGVMKYMFPRRNRIIAGMSKLTVVVESGRKSGALITAEYAIGYQRDVYVCIGSVYSPKLQGNLHLMDLDKGHPITYEALEFIEALGGGKLREMSKAQRFFAKLKTFDLDENDLMIIELVNQGNTTVEGVSRNLNKNIDKHVKVNLAVILAKLSLYGLISRDNFGNLYLNT